ncbi:hypothetical protein NHX12_029478 [Muraenolepis orangiensis]|uniref:Uncharacterized protein n=1 Tax=Muraenolepis orangiensis TaxID=630683 RepID=A0A9Q0EDT5_9TELE|nr:hypothetical protein NHX12_029478 [Muraenolepis orangiensis]
MLPRAIVHGEGYLYSNRPVRKHRMRQLTKQGNPPEPQNPAEGLENHQEIQSNAWKPRLTAGPGHRSVLNRSLVLAPASSNRDPLVVVALLILEADVVALLSTTKVACWLGNNTQLGFQDLGSSYSSFVQEVVVSQ